MAKKYTILLIPEGTNQVKRYSLPRLLLPLLTLIVTAAIGFGGYWFHQYRAVVCDLPDIQALQEQSRRQEAQINTFATRLVSFQEQMKDLKTFNHRLRVMAHLEKPGAPESLFGVGGPEAHASGQGVRLTNSVGERRMMAMQRSLDQLAAEVENERSIQKELAKFLIERRSQLASTPSIWPVRGWVTSDFGYRVSPFTGKRQFHAGMDISTRPGTRIVSPADGVVTFAGWESGYGRILVVNHGYGLVTRYAHLKAFKAKKGEKIKRGQTIALVGNSGRSSGPHLHYEVLMSGSPTNPRYFILD